MREALFLLSRWLQGWACVRMIALEKGKISILGGVTSWMMSY